MKVERKMRLKELLVKAFEGTCERDPKETDDEFITRCGNQGWGNKGGIGINLTPAISLTMQKKLVIPMKQKEKKYKI